MKKYKLKEYYDFNDIEKEFGKKIPKHKKKFNISDPYCQKAIRIAMSNTCIKDAPYIDEPKDLFEKSRKYFDGLYYVCSIFIHPLTKVEVLCKCLERI